MAGKEDDRRKDHRYDIEIKVDYSTREMFQSNYVTNISRGGVFIRAENPLPIHSEVSLKFTFPDSEVTIEAAGRVAWTYDIKKGTGQISPGMGIRFTSFPSEFKSFLEGYLKNLSSEQNERAS
jgi:uncharacterized protein (TIGR02266 family)